MGFRAVDVILHKEDGVGISANKRVNRKAVDYRLTLGSFQSFYVAVIHDRGHFFCT